MNVGEKGFEEESGPQFSVSLIALGPSIPPHYPIIQHNNLKSVTAYTKKNMLKRMLTFLSGRW